MHLGVGLAIDRRRLRHRGDHRLDIGGIPRLQASDEGVLADIAFGQEFLRRAAAHRAGDRGDDDVADTERGKDPLVGLAVCVVLRLEPVVVDVEQIRVLHDELAATQDPVARPGLVTVLGLNLVQQHREILVAAAPVTVSVNNSS